MADSYATKASHRLVANSSLFKSTNKCLLRESYILSMHKVQPTVTLSHACSIYGVEEDLGLIPINHNLVLSYLSGHLCDIYIYLELCAFRSS